MRATKRASLSTLPVEILDTIFSFLEPCDMRAIRRVNKRLNEISNQSFYCENEIFCWKKINNIRRIVKLLNGSKRSVFNLHIDSVNFEDDFVMTFFRKHGSKVHCLSFRDCNFPLRLLQNIILKCKALRSFSFTTSDQFVSSYVFDDFRKFEAQSIVLGEVTSLTFVSQRPQNWLYEPTFQRFISIFPNVTQLDIRISASSVRDPNCSVLTNYSIRNCILRMGKNLESLKMYTDQLLLPNVEKCLLDALPNLMHLSLDTTKFYMGPTEIRRWCTQLQRIPSLNMRNCLWSPDLLRALKLRHLTTRVDESVVRSNLFSELQLSEVQSVELIYANGLTIPDHRVGFPDNNYVNKTLAYLTLRNDNVIFSNTATLFPPYFCALIHLRLGMVSNAVLQSIFRNQKNLRSLYLGDCRRCNVHGFTGANDSRRLAIRELGNLEHLTIRRFRFAIAKSSYFEEAFQLPRLKYLSIDADEEDKIDRVYLPAEVFDSMKNLEALRLKNVGIAPFFVLKYLCERLKNLRYLYHCDYRVSDWLCILDLSESSFEDLRSRLNDRSYYDEKLKKVVLQNVSFNRTLFSPRISSFVVDWIVF